VRSGEHFNISIMVYWTKRKNCGIVYRQAKKAAGFFQLYLFLIVYVLKINNAANQPLKAASGITIVAMTIFRLQNHTDKTSIFCFKVPL
jgi:hypothetical protein